MTNIYNKCTHWHNNKKKINILFFSIFRILNGANREHVILIKCIWQQYKTITIYIWNDGWYRHSYQKLHTHTQTPIQFTFARALLQMFIQEKCIKCVLRIILYCIFGIICIVSIFFYLFSTWWMKCGT